MVSRLANTLLGDNAYGKGASAPILNPTHGGQFGFGNDYPALLSSSPYVRRNLIALVIEPPRGFELLDNPDYWNNMLRALFELHARTIDGLQAMVNVDTQGQPFGPGGEQFEAPTNVMRQASTPTLGIDEKYGRPFGRFFEKWITELIMDPITKFPNVITRQGPVPTDHLPDFYSATVMFIEPDPTHKFVDKAWLCANMFPKTAGEKQGRKDQVSGGELLSYNIEFSAVTQVGNGVDRYAQYLLDQMSVTGASPYDQPAFVKDIAADIRKAPAGYGEKIADAARSAIQP